jgi:acetyl esterase/lipase
MAAMETVLQPTEQVGDIQVWTNRVIRTIAGWDQVVDIYAPPGTGRPRPALVALHGGGWRVGAPAGWRAMALRLAARFDVVVVCGSYRLIDRALFPAQIQDAANVVRWVRQHAARWAIDHARIGAFGDSAGGYLSAMIALTHAMPGLAGGDALNGETAAIQALAVHWGPLDFIARWYGNGGRAGAEGGMLGAEYLADPTIYHLASPLAHVTAAAPPALFVQGRTDPVVHQQQAELAHAAWKRHGVPSELLLLDRIGHVPETDPADRERCEQRTMGFFAERLGMKARGSQSAQG